MEWRKGLTWVGVPFLKRNYLQQNYSNLHIALIVLIIILVKRIVVTSVWLNSQLKSVESGLVKCWPMLTLIPITHFRTITAICQMWRGYVYINAQSLIVKVIFSLSPKKELH